MILVLKRDQTRSSYWLVLPDSIHESLIQLFLVDTVEKYHVWLRSILSFFFLSIPPQEGRLVLFRLVESSIGQRLVCLRSRFLLYDEDFSDTRVGELMEEIGF